MGGIAVFTQDRQTQRSAACVRIQRSLQPNALMLGAGIDTPHTYTLTGEGEGEGLGDGLGEGEGEGLGDGLGDGEGLATRGALAGLD